MPVNSLAWTPQHPLVWLQQAGSFVLYSLGGNVLSELVNIEHLLLVDLGEVLFVFSKKERGRGSSTLRSLQLVSPGLALLLPSHLPLRPWPGVDSAGTLEGSVA